jgi:hypothetical protein
LKIPRYSETEMVLRKSSKARFPIIAIASKIGRWA